MSQSVSEEASHVAVYNLGALRVGQGSGWVRRDTVSLTGASTRRARACNIYTRTSPPLARIKKKSLFAAARSHKHARGLRSQIPPSHPPHFPLAKWSLRLAASDSLLRLHRHSVYDELDWVWVIACA
jgi:hypothetical protein